MSCHIVMEFTLKPSEVAKFKAMLVRHLPDARTFDGCRSAQVIENQDDADNIVIVEHWQSRTHFENTSNGGRARASSPNSSRIVRLNPTCAYSI